MNRVKCSVSTCKYNDDGKVCGADEIKVRNNFGTTDDMEIGNLEGESKARTSIETCCETFAPLKK